MTLPLVALGTVALDTVETPFGRVEKALGGSGTYFGLAASFFTECGIVSVVGADFPKKHLDYLEGKGIDVAGVERTDGKTFHWEGRYEHDMNAAETVKTELNVLESFDPKVPKEYRKCRFLFLANIDPVLQLKVLDEVRPEFSLCDTMNYWIDSKRSELTEVFKRVDGIIVNEGEAREYCDTPNLIKAGHMLTEVGGGKVIIKKGEHGALFFHGDEFFAAPGYPIPNVVDPTGAGDSFAGGTIGHLAKHGSFETADIKKSMVYGSVVASYVVEGFSIDAIKDRTESDIQARYETFREIVAFDHQI
jgi:sugar/nucleoside kinase (ribokinase family)